MSKGVILDTMNKLSGPIQEIFISVLKDFPFWVHFCQKFGQKKLHKVYKKLICIPFVSIFWYPFAQQQDLEVITA